VLFHGYTGSPGEFGALPEHLSRTFNAIVHVPLLPGHCTRVEDLMDISFEQLSASADHAMSVASAHGLPVIVGGHSFGGYLAMQSASSARPAAVFSTVMPYQMRWKYYMPLLNVLGKVRPLWNKRLRPEEAEERKRIGSYNKMPARGLWMVMEGNRRLPDIIGRIHSPILAIHAEHDLLAYPSSADALIAHSRAQLRESHVIANGRHSLFLSNDAHIVRDIITQFLHKALNTPL
jgi:carboxylesterase